MHCLKCVFLYSHQLNFHYYYFRTATTIHIVQGVWNVSNGATEATKPYQAATELDTR